MPAETKYKNWDLESFLDPVGFRAKLVSSEFFQGCAQSHSDHCKPKLCLEIWREFPGVHIRLKQMLMILLHEACLEFL